MKTNQVIKIGMADLKATNGKEDILRTTGLGSCVGLTLYDPVTKVGGMAHIMLPLSDIAKNENLNVAKYADTAVPELIRQMMELGAAKSRLIAKMAGGAQMFAFTGSSDIMRIGPRNIETTKLMLEQNNIPLIGEDTGLNFGRTIELDNATGILLIRSVQQGVKQI